MKKKPSLTFADLGLSTPLPTVLTKSKEERRKELVLQKKEKKERLKSAIEEVSSSRDAVEKHKQICQDEKLQERQEKQERKRILEGEHIQSRNKRKEAQDKIEAESRIAQQEFISKVLSDRKEEERRAQQVQEIIELEQRKVLKNAPKSAHIAIHRTADIDLQREGLPVLREEQPIVEAINLATRSCVLVCGETGSGKTTQIPQFLWEAGYGHSEGMAFGREGVILVTEPRRVAAISMARRVAEELNVEFGGDVCYHVRYDNNLSDSYKMKFATEGIVLKEIQSDFLLKKYSVIIVDEAHERSISCDILVGLLSRIMPLRNDLFREQLAAHNGDATKTTIKPLKLVIMSATMRVTDFRDNTTLFPITPQLINVEARRFPVTNHFARKTELKEYVDEAFEKVKQIHKKLPPGGILVFLCTQQEIEDMCNRLRQYYRKTKIEYYDNSYSKHYLLKGTSAEEDEGSSDDGVEASKKTPEVEKDEYGLATDDYNLDDDDAQSPSGGSDEWKRKRERTIRHNLGADDQNASANDSEINGEFETLHVLPLYALLDFNRQQEVFQAPPAGKRLCVIATNVAETSITIPNIKYVVDAGRVKSKLLDSETRASCFRIGWTSQASAEQRSGRAGRVGPGHCYRLFSTAVYSNLMEKHSVPEVLRTPLDSVVLLMKHIGIERVGAFPFPSAPKEDDLRAAIQHLSAIGALNALEGLRITELGRKLVSFPVPPRFARALVEIRRLDTKMAIVDKVCAIVAVCATTSNVFTGEGNQIKSSKSDANNDQRREMIRSLVNPGSDLLTYLNAFSVFLSHPPSVASRQYCLVQKSMQESKLLYYQLRRLVREQNIPDEVLDSLDTNETWSTDRSDHGSWEQQLSRDNEVILRKVFIPGLIDQIARRATVHECRTLGVEYNDKKTSRTPYLILSTRTIAYVHPTSAVSRTFPPPETVTYCFVQQVVRSESKEPQTMMLGVTVIADEWLSEYNLDEDAVGLAMPTEI